jgi:hypothetical protein
MTTGPTRTYPATLPSVDTGVPFVEFHVALHAAVPEVPSAAIGEVAAAGGTGRGSWR